MAGWHEVNLEGIKLEGGFMGVLSPNEQIFAAGYSGGKAVWWDLKARQPIPPTFDCPNAGPVWVAFSPDGKWFATWQGGTIQIVSTEHARIERVLQSPAFPLGFVSQGQTLVALSGAALLERLADLGADLRSYGDVISREDGHITLRVPKSETARVTERLLADLPVIDLLADRIQAGDDILDCGGVVSM